MEGPPCKHESTWEWPKIRQWAHFSLALAAAGDRLALAHDEWHCLQQGGCCSAAELATLPAPDRGEGHVHVDTCRSITGCKHTPVTKLPVTVPCKMLYPCHDRNESRTARSTGILKQPSGNWSLGGGSSTTPSPRACHCTRWGGLQTLKKEQKTNRHLGR